MGKPVNVKTLLAPTSVCVLRDSIGMTRQKTVSVGYEWNYMQLSTILRSRSQGAQVLGGKVKIQVSAIATGRSRPQKLALLSIQIHKI